MPLGYDFALGINNETGRDATDGIGHGCGCLESAFACPAIIALVPALIRKVIDCGFFCAVDAERNEFYFVGPFGMLGLIRLHLGHGRLTRATPTGPEIKNYNLAFEVH